MTFLILIHLQQYNSFQLNVRCINAMFLNSGCQLSLKYEGNEKVLSWGFTNN